MSETAEGPRRVPPYLTLEAWRGLAALWVVVLHAWLTRVVDFGPARLAGSPLRELVLKGQLGVTIFFVISGYCIANAATSARTRPRALWSFLRARARRIYPPYYASIVLWVGVSLVAAAFASRGLYRADGLGRLDFFRQGPLYYLSTLTLTQWFLGQELLIVIYWSLGYEIAFYGMVAVALAFTLRAGHAGPLLYALDALTIGLLGWLLVDPKAVPFPLDLWHQFGLGVLVYHVAATPGRAGPRVLFAIAAALLLAFALRHGEGGDFAHPSPRLQSYFSLGFAVALLALRSRDVALSRLRAVRFLSWVGAFSYSLYLTHFLVVTGMAQAGKRLPWGLASVPAVLMVVQVAASVAFARVFFAYCERPFMGRAAVVNPVIPGRAEQEATVTAAT